MQFGLLLCPLLLPYTTLFRSSRNLVISACCSGERIIFCWPVLCLACWSSLRRVCVSCKLASRSRILLWYRDRKSTRLNSSHSQISYAVFCLKKKSMYDVVDPL